MTGGQTANGIAAAFTAGTGSMFIISYGILAKWWRSLDGKMMMTFGAAITLTNALTLTMTIFGFSTSVDWLRFIQAFLMAGIGLAFASFTLRVWKAQVIRTKRYEEEEEF